jgi:L-lactate dehydrogenase complex protein LldG
MSARDEILARVRSAQSGHPAEVARNYETSKPRDLALLAQRLEDYRAVVHHCSETEIPDVLRGLLRGTVAVPDGLPAQWLTQVDGELLSDPLTARELDAITSVITTCATAICDTGTLVLDSGPGPGRRALTLVPDHHVVVVLPDVIVGSVPEALARLDPTRPLTWISGPSATSDIELQRVEGVHGPRRLDVVLLSPED